MFIENSTKNIASERVVLMTDICRL